MDGAGDIACFGRAEVRTQRTVWGAGLPHHRRPRTKMRSLEERAFSAIGGDLMMYDDRDELAILGA